MRIKFKTHKITRTLGYIVSIIVIILSIYSLYSTYERSKILEIIEKYDIIELVSDSKLLKKYDSMDLYNKNRGIILADNKSNYKINLSDKLLIGYLKLLKNSELLENCEIYFIKELKSDVPFLHDYKYDNIILGKFRGKYFVLSQEIYTEIIKNNLIEK